MPKIEMDVGKLKLIVEGDEGWVAEQFMIVAAKAAELAPIASSLAGESDGGAITPDQGPLGSLASHIKEHGGEKSQPRRFLATADWLRRKGDKSLKTSKVSAALKENQQKKLGNPSQCLNDNVSQGFCEKDAQGFFITPEGLKELGYQA